MTATGTRFFAIAAAAILFAVAAPAGAAERQTNAAARGFAAAVAAVAEAAADPALDAPRPTPQRAAGCAMGSQRIDGRGCANAGAGERERQVRAVRA
jgi:hypothetical protein